MLFRADFYLFNRVKYPMPPQQEQAARASSFHTIIFLKNFFKKNKITSPLWQTPKFTFTMRGISGGNSVKFEKHSLHTYILLTINKLYPPK